MFIVLDRLAHLADKLGFVNDFLIVAKNVSKIKREGFAMGCAQ